MRSNKALIWKLQQERTETTSFESGYIMLQRQGEGRKRHLPPSVFGWFCYFPEKNLTKWGYKPPPFMKHFYLCCTFFIFLQTVYIKLVFFLVLFEDPFFPFTFLGVSQNISQFICCIRFHCSISLHHIFLHTISYLSKHFSVS